MSSTDVVYAVNSRITDTLGKEKVYENSGSLVQSRNENIRTFN